MSSCSASEARSGRREKGDRGVAFFFCTLVLLLALAGCAGGPGGGKTAAPREPWRGSVVVFSFDVMRADHVGALGGPSGLTPQLDRFAAEADFKGRAVAASSTPLVALASLFTGTGALQHRVLGHLHAKLRPSLPTLAELFWREGYDTVFFEPRPTWIWRYGLVRGMARDEGFSEEQTLHELPLFDASPRFYWIQLPEADAPYTDRRAEIAGGAAWPAPSRSSVGGEELLPYADPARPLPPELQRAAAELFRIETAAGDARFGRLLAGLQQSAAWDDTVVVVTASTGTELGGGEPGGEPGQGGGVLYGQNLHRASLEVPLLIRLPKSLRDRGFRFAEPPGRPVAAERLFATLAECLGSDPGPLASPSLFRQARLPAISALPMGNGTTLYSAVFPAPRPGVLAEQLIRRSRFGQSEPRYYDAQAAEAGAALDLPEAPRLIFERLRQQFEHASPWESAEVALEGVTWTAAGGTAPLADPARLRTLGDALARGLFRGIEAERTAEQEDALILAVERPAENEAKGENGGGGKGESAPAGAG